ncbi:MAG: hypothetical protein L0H41_05045 [Microlunatus sp.]|nr:hypothetical protein [Microlunatus sp.]MDN5769675.1 hypothetical protein [Microlunatus sp.]
MSTISAPQDAVAKWQTDALESIKYYQDATVKTVEAWTQAVAKMSPNAPATPDLPVEMKAAFGDPVAMVDSSYDFASQLLDLNKKFAHDLLDAQQVAAKQTGKSANK